MAALETALAIAAQGIAVFPCGKNKRPAISEDEGGHGFHDATLDADGIRELFARAPHAVLVGAPTGEKTGFDVLDIDPRHGGDTWEKEQLDRLPETRIHQTPGGGRHYLFRHAPGVRNSSGHLRKDGSVGGIALGVDVRGDGGYVILPPCAGYRIVHEAEIAEWPDWLLDIMLREPEPPPARVNGFHHPVHIESRRLDGFTKAVQDRVRGAAEGSKHFVLRNAALSLGGIADAAGLSDEEATQLLLQSLPGTVKDWKNAAKTIAWGLTHGRNRPIELEERRPAATTRPPQTDSIPPDIEDLAPASGHHETIPVPTLPLVWYSDIVPQLDARDFVQGVLMEQSAAVVYGQSNSGKTFWTTDLALHIAAGRPWCGRRVDQGGVVYCVLEGGIGFQNRVSAWKEETGLGGYDLPFVSIPAALNLLSPDGDTERLIAAIAWATQRMTSPLKLIVIDTLARALAGGNENAPDDMGALVVNMDLIREKTGAAVLFVHHSGKDQARGARGHSSLQAAIDTEIEVVDTETGGIRTATVAKQRELTKGDVFEFSLRVVELGSNKHKEPVTTCVVEPCVEAAGVRRHTPSGVSALRNLKGHNRRALEVLTDLLAASGKSGYAGVPDGFTSVPEDWWRENFYDCAMAGAEQDAKKRAFRRAADHLVGVHLAGMNAGRVWLVHYKEPGQNGT